jgi:hypothetical protein
MISSSSHHRPSSSRGALSLSKKEGSMFSLHSLQEYREDLSRMVNIVQYDDRSCLLFDAGSDSVKSKSLRQTLKEWLSAGN